MSRWLLLCSLLPLVLPGCQLIEPDQFLTDYEEPGSRLEGGAVVARWTAQPFPWEVTIPIGDSQLTATPGETWTSRFDASVDLSAWSERHGRPSELIVAVLGEWRHDEEGHYRVGPHTFSVSSNFTTTGVPVERSDSWPDFRLLHGKNGSPFEAVVVRPVTAADLAAPLRFAGELVADLPDDLPPGWYEPQVHLLVRVDGVEHPVHLAEFSYEWNDWKPGILPLVRVGAAAPLQLPWTIFSEYPQAGRVGTLPIELKGRVGQVGRSGFIGKLVLRPGVYSVHPTMPTLFPRDAIARVDGGDDVQTERSDHF